MINLSANASNHWKDSGTEDRENLLTVNSCGYQKFVSKNLEIVRSAGRADYQIIYILNGKGYYKLRDGYCEVLKGNIIVYPPGIPQLYKYYFEDAAEVYWVHFTGSAAGEQLKALGLSGAQVHCVGVHLDLTGLYKKIMNELQLKRSKYEHFAAAYFLELLSHFSRIKLDREGRGRQMDDAIKNAIGLMHRDYNKKFSVEYFAKECNLSLFRFIHKFKLFAGMTPVEYLTKIRVDEAKYLLSNSMLNVTEISSIVGYDNPLYFSRVFKKATGVAPSHYKAQNTPEN